MAACTWGGSMVWAPVLAASIQAARQSRQRLRASPLLELVKRLRAHGSARFGGCGSNESELACAPDRAAFAEFGGERGEQAAAAQAGVGQKQRAKQATVQTVEPAAHQGRLAHPIGTGPEPDTAQGG